MHYSFGVNLPNSFVQFVPLNFMARCHLLAGQEVALVDCIGRTQQALVESCCGVNFVGDGWPEFLKYIGASMGDHLLFMFESIRTCNVFVFHDELGWQKYPFIENTDLGRVLLPRLTGNDEFSTKQFPIS